MTEIQENVDPRNRFIYFCCDLQNSLGPSTKRHRHVSGKGDYLRFMAFLDTERITRCHIMQIIRVGDLSSRETSMDYILSAHQHQIHD